ncbi:MAG: metallophosphoesterase family protein [Acidimicrobiales bacterium]|nr:metallophosphoesterase family protein [Acidimicrobiales bacterium]
MNDIHIGETHFGAKIPIREADDLEPYPARCLRAALREAKEWGAQSIVCKGDLTDAGIEEEFAWFATLIREDAVDPHMILGNHDIRAQDVDGAAILRARGLHVATSPEAIDFPGLRVVLLPSARGYHGGHWEEHADAAIALAAEADGPVFVATHHYPHRFPIKLKVPSGVALSEAKPFLDELHRVAPGSLIACGHTHRHHRRHYKSLLITEIGSPKDYPGVWAGYVVYEGGIRQVVHKIHEPSARAWLDRSGRTLFGAWRYWSPGIPTHRNWTWSWPTPR